MPRIELHKSTRKGRPATWVLRHWVGNGKRPSETIGKVGEMSKREAQRLQREKQSKMDAGKIPTTAKPSKKMTLAAFMKIYAERRRQGDTGRGFIRSSPKLSQPTITLHTMTIRYLIQHFGGERSIDSITLPDAERFIDALAAGELKAAYKPKQREQGMCEQTVRKHLRNCKAVMSWAVRFGFISKNPFDDFDGKPLPTKANHFISLADFETIIKRLNREAFCLQRLIMRADKMLDSASPSKQGKLRQRRRRMVERLAVLPGWRVMLALCRLAGLRRTEALNLPWADKAIDCQGEEHWVGIDWERRRISIVAAKTKAFRVIPICPRLYEILLETFEQAEAGTLSVVGLSEHNLIREGQSIVRASGLTVWAKLFQAMRSSCENDWKQQGVAEPTYAAWAGHSVIVSRQSYTAPLDTEFASITQPAERD